MSGEKLFSTAFFGFKKKHVNSYLEKMNKEYEEKIKIKEKEIADIKAQYRDIKSKYDELNSTLERIREDREKIANTLITAQEKADLIIDEARMQAISEKKILEKQVEEEKEKLVDIKQELKVLKVEVVDKLKKYEGELSGFIQE
jgi:cell division initiation protein